MKNIVLLSLLLLIASCAAQDKKVEASGGPEVYGSIRMGVDSGKTTDTGSYIGIKNH